MPSTTESAVASPSAIPSTLPPALPPPAPSPPAPRPRRLPLIAALWPGLCALLWPTRCCTCDALTEPPGLCPDCAPGLTPRDGPRCTRCDLTLPADVPGRVDGVTQPAPSGGRNTPSNGFDAILVVHAWHHVAHRAELARDVAAALKRGGRVVVVEFAPDAQRGPPIEMRLAPDQVIADLVGAGLDARVAAVALPEQYVVEAQRP